MTRPGSVSGVVLAAAVLLAAPRIQADEPKPAAAPPEKAAKGDQDKKDDKDKKGAKTASPAPRRVYTEEDLKKYSEDPEGKARAKPGTQERAVPEEPMPDSSQEHGGQPLWNNKASAARDRIAEAEGLIATLENRITGLRNDMAPGREMEPFRLQGIQADITKAMEELEAARKELAKARTAYDDLLTEARRLGVPNGWVREP
jgi:hypothetical protein